MTSVEPPKLNSPELKAIRRNLFGLLVVNFLIYVTILIPLSLCAMPNTAFYSIPIIAGYYVHEGSLFFGCQVYNWPCTVTFRIIWALHDFCYFITYAVKTSESSEYHNETYYAFTLACSIFFLFTLGIGIGIIFAYSKFRQNPNVGNNRTNSCGIPQTVQYTTQTTRTVQQVAQQPAVQQPIPQQNDLPPSYDNVCS